MKIQDILRQLVDALDGIEHTSGNPANAVDSADAALVPVSADTTDHTESDVMIPPLQAKLELLKRATDVPNVYDDMDHDCGCESDCDCHDDELVDIRTLAGVPTTAVFTAGDDEPLDE